jgi:hypothetical protein
LRALARVVKREAVPRNTLPRKARKDRSKVHAAVERREAGLKNTLPRRARKDKLKALEKAENIHMADTAGQQRHNIRLYYF